MQKLWPYTLFLILVLIFLWKPIFRGDALLPGDYLAQMSPWNSVVKPSDPPPQWNPLAMGRDRAVLPLAGVLCALDVLRAYPILEPSPILRHAVSGKRAIGCALPIERGISDLRPDHGIYSLRRTALVPRAGVYVLASAGTRLRGTGRSRRRDCFAFSAFMVLWLELADVCGVAVWLPLVLLLIHWSVERKSLAYARVCRGRTRACPSLPGTCR